MGASRSLPRGVITAAWLHVMPILWQTPSPSDIRETSAREWSSYESGGAFVSVSDEEILGAIPMLARKAGVFGEPAGVAGAAGVKRAVESGIIGRSGNCGDHHDSNGLKDIQSAIRARGNTIAVQPDMEEVSKSRKYRSDSLMLLIAAINESEKSSKWQRFRSVLITMKCLPRA